MALDPLKNVVLIRAVMPLNGLWTVAVCLLVSVVGTGGATVAQNGPLPGLPLNSDRCAILWALTGQAQDGCHAPTLSGQTLRSLGSGLEPGSGGMSGGQGYFVHFDFNSSRLPPQVLGHMTELAQLLSGELTHLCIKLVGHTDTVGSAQYNHSLSMERAQAVRLFLAGPGAVDPLRLRTDGMGESYPLPGLPGDAAQNRRVEIMARPMMASGCL